MANTKEGKKQSTCCWWTSVEPLSDLKRSHWHKINEKRLGSSSAINHSPLTCLPVVHKEEAIRRHSRVIWFKRCPLGRSILFRSPLFFEELWSKKGGSSRREGRVSMMKVNYLFPFLALLVLLRENAIKIGMDHASPHFFFILSFPLAPFRLEFVTSSPSLNYSNINF